MHRGAHDAGNAERGYQMSGVIGAVVGLTIGFGAGFLVGLCVGVETMDAERGEDERL